MGGKRLYRLYSHSHEFLLQQTASFSSICLFRHGATLFPSRTEHSVPPGGWNSVLNKTSWFEIVSFLGRHHLLCHLRLGYSPRMAENLVKKLE